MCTVILLRRPGAACPLLLAANRDERLERSWDAPAEFWPAILGGRDATAGGTWMALVYGFARYRWRGTRFAPMLPTRANRLRFPLRVRGSVLEVDIEPRRVTYSVKNGTAHIAVCHYDTEVTVEPGSPVTFPGDYRTNDAATVADS